MFSLRRSAVKSAGRISKTSSLATKRYSSTEHGTTGHDAKHSEHSHDHHHSSPPKPESLGKGFFLVLGAVPLSIAVYTFSQQGKEGKNPLTKILDGYSDYTEKWEARTQLHTAAIERAAFDRNLFQSTPGSRHIDLKFPEIFNTGSPYNVHAGQGARNMDQLVAHYQKVNQDEEARRISALQKKDE